MHWLKAVACGMLIVVTLLMSCMRMVLIGQNAVGCVGLKVVGADSWVLSATTEKYSESYMYVLCNMDGCLQVYQFLLCAMYYPLLFVSERYLRLIGAVNQYNIWSCV